MILNRRSSDFQASESPPESPPTLLTFPPEQNSTTMHSSSNSLLRQKHLKTSSDPKSSTLNRRSFLQNFGHTLSRAASSSSPSSYIDPSREIIKEGVVNYISSDSSTFDSSQQKWEKCRLVLVKSSTDSNASLLEFYSPLKSFKPRCGLFCFLIDEARATSSLEVPDREFTFVLKVSVKIYRFFCL